MFSSVFLSSPVSYALHCFRTVGIFGFKNKVGKRGSFKLNSNSRLQREYGTQFKCEAQPSEFFRGLSIDHVAGRTTKNGIWRGADVREIAQALGFQKRFTPAAGSIQTHAVSTVAYGTVECIVQFRDNGDVCAFLNFSNVSAATDSVVVVPVESAMCAQCQRCLTLVNFVSSRQTRPRTWRAASQLYFAAKVTCTCRLFLIGRI